MLPSYPPCRPAHDDPERASRNDNLKREECTVRDGPCLRNTIEGIEQFARLSVRGPGKFSGPVIVALRFF
jgi:hypothetical protein